jgi:hypothetical protein
MKIEFCQKWYDNALNEQKMRAPHMLTKYGDTPARKAGQIRGLVIEHHIGGWFKKNYPECYEEPDNYQQWTKPCPHDFKLKINGKTLYIDVTGPRKDGTFGSYSQKPKQGVDFHIIAKPIGFVSWNNVDYKQGFKIIGVVEARDYKQNIDENKIINFEDWLKKIGLNPL